jgi:uncharacterized membrane protein
MSKIVNLIAVLVTAVLIAVMEHNAHPYFYGYLFTYATYVGYALLLIMAVMIIKETKKV